MQTKTHKTSVLIDNDKKPKDDWDFIQARHFKPTNLLRIKIKELREIEEGAPDPKILLSKLGIQQKFRDNLLKFIADKGLTDEMFKTINL